MSKNIIRYALIIVIIFSLHIVLVACDNYTKKDVIGTYALIQVIKDYKDDSIYDEIICIGPYMIPYDYKDANVYLKIDENSTFEYKISGYDSDFSDIFVEGTWKLKRNMLTLICSDDKEIVFDLKNGEGIFFEIESDDCIFTFELCKL